MNAQPQHAPSRRHNRKNRQKQYQRGARHANEASFTPIAAVPARHATPPQTTAHADGEFSPMAYEKAAGAVQVTSDSTLTSLLAYAAKAVSERDALMVQLRQAMSEDSHPMEHMVAREWCRRMAAAGVSLYEPGTRVAAMGDYDGI
jgi:hypothetical protein